MQSTSLAFFNLQISRKVVRVRWESPLPYVACLLRNLVVGKAKAGRCPRWARLFVRDGTVLSCTPDNRCSLKDHFLLSHCRSSWEATKRKLLWSLPWWLHIAVDRIQPPALPCGSRAMRQSSSSSSLVLINAKNCRFKASVTMTLIKRRKRQKFVYCIFAC